MAKLFLKDIMEKITHYTFVDFVCLCKESSIVMYLDLHNLYRHNTFYTMYHLLHFSGIFGQHFMCVVCCLFCHGR